MENKGKDYLHLYLGCELNTGGWFNKAEAQKILEAVEPSRKIAVVGFYYPMKDDSCIKSERWEFPIIDMKPILRPLSDMTDKEIDEVASILLDKETNCYHKWRSEDGDYIIATWKKEQAPPYDKEKYDYMTMGMMISGDFSIKHHWDYHSSKGVGTTNEPLHNSHKITRYLLSKHFDLFGLIESGEAIDKTTIESNIKK